MKNLRLILFVLVLLSAPTFFRMLKPGIYSMQDFHLFRLYEFDRCAKDLQLPCRWVPDVGFGYGQPLFNFYTQVPYAVGEVFILLGFSKIDSVKLLFILSLMFSGISMFFLTKRLWNNTASAILSSVVYLYAPYRAVDVWVRGALPEAFAFALFPIVVLFFHDYILTKKTKSLILFSISFAVLIVTHNLSALMFLLFLATWGAFLIFKTGNYKLVFPLAGSAVFSLLLSAFYILPITQESKLVHLDYTTTGYFDFRGHFVAIPQILFSRFWGYGASVFGIEDGLSLSVGQVQWIIPLIALFVVFIKKQKDKWLVLALAFIGWVTIFLMHNKSAFIWEKIPTLAYIQFPWRWLSISLFCFSLASGSLMAVFGKYKNYICGLLIIFVIAINISFFREDIWYDIGDSEQFSGKKWEQQIVSSIGDYWPIYATGYPQSPAPNDPVFKEGNGVGQLLEKRSNNIIYKMVIDSKTSTVQFPIAYFPGWELRSDRQNISIKPTGEFGLITGDIPKGEHNIYLYFSNTASRKLGNAISLASIIGIAAFFILRRFKHAN